MKTILERLTGHAPEPHERFFLLRGAVCILSTFVGLAAVCYRPIAVLPAALGTLFGLLLTLWGLRSGRYAAAITAIVLFDSVLCFPMLYICSSAAGLLYLPAGPLLCAVLFGHTRRLVMLCVAIVSSVAALLYENGCTARSLGAALLIALLSAALFAVASFCVHILKREYRQTEALNTKFRRQLQLDPLTGVYNRSYLIAQIETRLSANVPFSLVMLDLDGFKSINDSCGHAVGDRRLIRFCAVLSDTVSGNGFVARYGGDEFMLLLRTTDYTQIEDIFTRTRQALQQEQNDGCCAPFTFSGGVQLADSSSTVSSLFDAVDAKLYRAKQQGRDRVLFD